MTKLRKTTAKKHLPDVSAPGKTAPASTSRPVIITNRPVIKDPMTAPTGSPASTLAHNTNKKLTPLHVPVAATEPMKPKAVHTTAPQISEVIARASQRAATVPSEAPKPATKPIHDVVEKPVAKPAAKKTTKPVSDEAKPNQAPIEQLVANKTYFLPINAVEKRRTKRFVALGIVVSVLLLLAWLDIALDAGLLTLNGVQPVTQFF